MYLFSALQLRRERAHLEMVERAVVAADKEMVALVAGKGGQDELNKYVAKPVRTQNARCLVVASSLQSWVKITYRKAILLQARLW